MCAMSHSHKSMNELHMLELSMRTKVDFPYDPVSLGEGRFYVHRREVLLVAD